MTEKWKLRQDPEYQRKVSDFVSREVIYCVSSLIHELASKPDLSYDSCSFGELYHDILSQPDYESDDPDAYHEALEHWIITDWLADKLEAKGEMVNKDVLGLTIWVVLHQVKP